MQFVHIHAGRCRTLTIYVVLMDNVQQHLWYLSYTILSFPRLGQYVAGSYKAAADYAHNSCIAPSLQAKVCILEKLYQD